MLSKIFTARVIERKNLTHNVRELVLVPDEPVIFRAGQFGLFSFPASQGVIERAYSFASPPQETERMIICYKVHDDGVSTQFFEHAAAETQFSVSGPHGQFTLDVEGEPITLVATGTGLAPYRSMLIDALQYKKSERQIALLFGVRSQEDIFWQDFLDELASKYKNFSYRITLSQPREAWSGLTGRVTERLKEDLERGAKNFYLCGSPSMVVDARTMLMQNGIAPQDIHFEIFT